MYGAARQMAEMAISQHRIKLKSNVMAWRNAMWHVAGWPMTKYSYHVWPASNVGINGVMYRYRLNASG